MGLLNKKNIAMAKKFADKNKDKIASGVKKATDTIDEKTGCKHTDKLKKLDDAAQKFAGVDQPSTGAATAGATRTGGPATASTTATPRDNPPETPTATSTGGPTATPTEAAAGPDTNPNDPA
ncbi:MAG: Rv0909 family putative TA system antitoxin [Ilumatobacteraceae bacterium]